MTIRPDDRSPLKMSTSRLACMLLQVLLFLGTTGYAQHLSEVRLVNGSSSLTGTVQIFDGARSAWFTMCHTPSWGIADVLVICRQLGHAGGSRAFSVEEAVPERPLAYYDQQLLCTGSEAEVNGCPRLFIDQSTLESCIPAWASCYDQNFLGCYRDSRYDRVLAAAIYPMTNMMSPQRCIDFCLEGGHALAAVEYGSECYCGAAGANYERLGRASDRECQMPCQGLVDEVCGGVNTMAVFKTSTATTTVPTTTVPTTTPSPTTTEKSTELTTSAPPTPRVTAVRPTQIVQRARTRFPPITASTLSVSMETAQGNRAPPSTIIGLASTGGALFVACSAVLLFLTVHRSRRKKKTSIVDDPSPYALSASIEVVMDTTYLDPMNSISDSAVYSGVSQVSESDFDSTFGGIGGDGGGDGGRGEMSMYLGLSFKEMERRQDEDYASLNAGLRKEGSFATNDSHDAVDARRATYGDGTDIDGESFETIPLESRGQIEGEYCGLYDTPHSSTVSAIYVSGNGISPYAYGVGIPGEGEYTSVHLGSYCEIGDGAATVQVCAKRDPKRPIPPKRRDRSGAAGSREYASVFPVHSRQARRECDERMESVTYQNGSQLEGREYALVADLKKSDSSATVTKSGQTKTLPATGRTGLNEGISAIKPRNGDYDSVYFEGNKTLSDSRSRSETLPLASSADYSEYALINDDDEKLSKCTVDDDTFEPADDAAATNYDSYSYVDQDKLLVGKSKRRAENLALSEDSFYDPSYENVTEKSQKSTPKLSVSSVLSQISSLGQTRKYSSLDEEFNQEHSKKSICDGRAVASAPPTRISQDTRESGAEYAVVDKGLRNSQPAVTHTSIHTDIVADDDDDDDYDILQHTVTEK
ncbi:uncharacterized protein [Diadema antillarum]|uniref:uncharacterized protein n=1 Tax=Diadema antillarum TaxID=105358 RepID=UPI003A8948FF